MNLRTTTIGIAGSMAIALASTAAAASVFQDVPETHWAYPAVQWAYAHHIMTGPGGQERLFYPERPATRAELAQVSMRLHENIETDINTLARRVIELENQLNASATTTTSATQNRIPTATSTRVNTQQAIQERAAARNQAYIPNMQNVQTRSGNPVAFYASLLGSNEKPPVRTNGRGSATFTWTSSGLWYDISAQNLSSTITNAYLQIGKVGENGTETEEIFFNNGRSRGYWQNMSAAEWRALTNGEVYINIRTTEHPGGEIRGQIQMNR